MTLWPGVPLGAGGKPRAGVAVPGWAVQVDPTKPTLKPLRSKRLKPEHEILLSNFAFNFKLRRYNLEMAGERSVACFEMREVGRCRLTLSNPR